MAIKTPIYPILGNTKAKNLSEVDNFLAELNTALGKYFKDESITDFQGVKLTGINQAMTSVKDYKTEIKGTKNDLAVRAGINGSGHLAMTITGILPRKGKPEKIDEEVVIRKDFATLVEEMKNEANVVVNLQKGDATIDRAAGNQAKKFGTNAVEPDDADFGELKSGNVILAAHGSRLEVSGTIIGVKLGKRTAKELVDLLTEGNDKKKRLNRAFSGTVWLSGCFTASGGIAPPGDDYDYESFARTVWELLKKKGYTKAVVKGQPGIARTDSEGDKSSVTPTGQKDYDKLKKQLLALQKEIKELAVDLAKLKKDHPDEDELRTIPTYVKKLVALNELNKIAKDINAEKEAHVIKGLVATYGLKVR
jgi:hypothetical protein